MMSVEQLARCQSISNKRPKCHGEQATCNSLTLATLGNRDYPAKHLNYTASDRCKHFIEIRTSHKSSC